jgi:hypothetical protein
VTTRLDTYKALRQCNDGYYKEDIAMTANIMDTRRDLDHWAGLACYTFIFF